MQSSNPRPATGDLRVYPAKDSSPDDFSTDVCPRPNPSSLRESLRAATSEIHANLHLHAGFASIQDGTIDLAAYRSLLVRLYGFHVSFEAALGLEGHRSAWLREDLSALGLDGPTAVAEIPRCTALTAFPTQAARLGALYVVEGSTLGGRHLARGLDPLLGHAASVGRRFFLGRGADTNTAWNAFLARMASAVRTAADRGETVAAAVKTFRIYQEWLNGWRHLAQ